MDERELSEKIAALQAELERVRFEKRRNGVAVLPPPPLIPPAAVIPPPPAVPPPPALKLGHKPCPVCRVPRPPRGACPGCSFEPVTRTAPESDAALAAPGLLDAFRAWSRRVWDLARQEGFERFLGERLFGYVGMLLVVLGGAFFLKYAAAQSGPWGRVAVGALGGFGAVGAGEWLRRRPRLKALSVPVVAGGWALVTYVAYAAYAVPASQVVTSSGSALGLLAAAAAGMIVHAVAARERLLTGFAFAAAYFAFAATDFGPQTLGVCTVLALAGAWLTRRLRQPELVPIGLVGYAVNYWPSFTQALTPGAAHPRVLLDLGAVAAVYAATALAARGTAQDARERSWTDAALAFGTVLMGVAVHAQSAVLGPWSGAAAGLAAAGTLALLAAARGEEGGGSAGAVQAFLATASAALACWRLPTPEGWVWGFALVSTCAGGAAVALRRPSVERHALALAGLGALTFLTSWSTVWAPAVFAGPAAAFGLAAYVLAFLGAGTELRSGVWLYAGLAGLLGALAVSLSPAHFAAATAGLALLLRLAWAATGAAPLYQQALLTAAWAGAVFLGVEAAAPRALPGVGLVAGVAALLAWPGAEGSFLRLPHPKWRAGLAWLALADAAYAAYGSFDPRLRLPGMAVACLALLAMGRRRGELGADLRAQAYLLAAAAPVMGSWTYLWGTLAPLTPRDAILYGLSAFALLAPLSWRAWAETEAEALEERGAVHALPALSLAMLALFVAHEAAGTLMTLWWTALGGGFLTAGLAGGRRELRWPALVLLGLCVGKALLHDLTGLPLPYRMLSMTALGLLLVLSSLAYVRFTREDGAELRVDGGRS